MKNQTPIKRHPAIVSFSKDHHFGLLLVWKIRQGLEKAVDAERISNYILFFFKEDLEAHFKEEEQLLFSRLPVDDSLRKQAESDHRSIYTLVAAIERKKDDLVLLRRLANELEKHIRFEERELFNHLQKNINLSDLEKIAKRFSNSSKIVDEKWNDVFWETKLTGLPTN
jgi:iron-sulfur cluster repair protein YtfE (RIC family)